MNYVYGTVLTGVYCHRQTHRLVPNEITVRYLRNGTCAA